MARHPNRWYQQDGGIAVLPVSGPEERNARDAATVDALDRFVRDGGSDDSARAVIVTRAGERSIVAGADIEADPASPRSKGGRGGSETWRCCGASRRWRNP